MQCELQDGFLRRILTYEKKHLLDTSPILLKMKTLVLFAVVMAISGGCRLFKSDDPEPKTELEKLPPITQEGKNTFGCLVNGTAFVVTNTSNMVTIYQGGSLELSGGIYIDKKVHDIQIFVGDLMESNKSFSLTNDTNRAGKYYEEQRDCWFSTGSNFTGVLTISLIDQTNFTISGTFEFEAYSSDCTETVKITHGRFDTQYIP
jgi:hypothetical protein